jgi:hypothetical protein
MATSPTRARAADIPLRAIPNGISASHDPAVATFDSCFFLVPAHTQTPFTSVIAQGTRRYCSSTRSSWSAADKLLDLLKRADLEEFSAILAITLRAIRAELDRTAVACCGTTAATPRVAGHRSFGMSAHRSLANNAAEGLHVRSLARLARVRERMLKEEPQRAAELLQVSGIIGGHCLR